MTDQVAFLMTALGAGAILAGAGRLLVWSARRGEAGALKRNQFIGVRIPATLASDEAWHRAHVAAARDTRRAGHGSVVGGIALGLVGTLGFAEINMDTLLIVFGTVSAATTAWLLAWVMRGASAGQKAAVDPASSSAPPARE